MSDARSPRPARFDDVTRYAPDLRPATIDLSDNTNLWGAAPSAVRAMAEVEAGELVRYPQAYTESLKAAIAAFEDVPPEWIVTGCGSDDVLDSAMRTCAPSGTRLVYPDPTFGMIPTFARLNGLVPLGVPLREDFDADVDAMTKAAMPREAEDDCFPVTYLCSPNNPTGVPFSRRAVEAIVANTHGPVIIDEAYGDFADTRFTDLCRDNHRVLVTRTMSKAFGLAGIRLGYAIAAPPLAERLEKSRGPYKVSALAARTAQAALENDVAWMRARVAEAAEVRERFARGLRDLGFAPLPSTTNFVLVPVARATELADALRAAHGIAVRPFIGLAAPKGSVLAAVSGNALRITVAPWPLLAPILDFLADTV